jgi:hypothetical protein
MIGKLHGLDKEEEDIPLWATIILKEIQVREVTTLLRIALIPAYKIIGLKLYYTECAVIIFDWFFHR